MRAVVQRARDARVEVAGRVVGAAARGLLVYLGVQNGDGEADARLLAAKICRLRVFADAEDKMNLSVKDIGGSLLVVSQFTLCADLSKGNRPSFNPAAPPDEARRLCEVFVDAARAEGLRVETGEFGAHMRVFYENDGPVTIIYDTKARKPL